MAVLHQFVPTYLRNDAVGEHTFLVRSLLVGAGIESNVYAHGLDPELRSHGFHISEYCGGPVVYQYAVGSDLADRLVAGSEPFAVNSHNATPARFFSGWGVPPIVAAAALAERQLAELAPAASLGVGDSHFNAEAMRAAGFGSPQVAPLLFDAGAFDVDVDLPTLDRLRATKQRGHQDWLFVGRLVPNKAQHDLLLAFAHHRREAGPGSRLWLLGRTDVPRYERLLRRLVELLGMEEAVTITGAVHRSELAAYFRSADVFVCLSDHEGFCLPLVEAMHCDLPVVAFDAGAVGETVADAAVLLPRKDPATVAAAVDAMADARLRTCLIEAGRSRVAELSLTRTGPVMLDLLTRWLEDASAAPGLLH